MTRLLVLPLVLAAGCLSPVTDRLDATNQQLAAVNARLDAVSQQLQEANGRLGKMELELNESNRQLRTTQDLLRRITGGNP